jgi:hypothetical protein
MFAGTTNIQDECVMGTEQLYDRPSSSALFTDLRLSHRLNEFPKKLET